MPQHAWALHSVWLSDLLGMAGWYWPPNHAYILIQETMISECHFTEKKDSLHMWLCKNLEMRIVSWIIWWVLTTITSVLTKERQRDVFYTYRQTHTEKAEIRSKAATNPGMLAFTRSSENRHSPRASRESGTLATPLFGPVMLILDFSRIVRE